MMTLGDYLRIAETLGSARGLGKQNNATQYVHQLSAQSIGGLSTVVRSDDSPLLIRIDHELNDQQQQR